MWNQRYGKSTFLTLPRCTMVMFWRSGSDVWMWVNRQICSFIICCIYKPLYNTWSTINTVLKKHNLSTLWIFPYLLLGYFLTCIQINAAVAKWVPLARLTKQLQNLNHVRRDESYLLPTTSLTCSKRVAISKNHTLAHSVKALQTGRRCSSQGTFSRTRWELAMRLVWEAHLNGQV